VKTRLGHSDDAHELGLAAGAIRRFRLNCTLFSRRAQRVLDFIQGERSCCLFFTFELVFLPNQGPLWLHIRGPEGVKEMIKDMLAEKG